MTSKVDPPQLQRGNGRKGAFGWHSRQQKQVSNRKATVEQDSEYLDFEEGNNGREIASPTQIHNPAGPQSAQNLSKLESQSRLRSEPLELNPIFSKSEESGDVSPVNTGNSSSNESVDAINHRRLVINKVSAILSAQGTLSPDGIAPFSLRQTIICQERMKIPNINDDFCRELGFYRQSLDAARAGRRLLRKEGVPFTRPSDFFSEMVKSDEHMGMIKSKMVHSAASQRSALEIQKLRNLRRFGKQVQNSKLKERERTKKETLAKIGLWKRDRDHRTGKDTEQGEIFNLASKEAPGKARGLGSAVMDRSRRKGQKNARFGYGGEKEHLNINEAASTKIRRGLSVKRTTGRKLPTRLGKRRRATEK